MLCLSRLGPFLLPRRQKPALSYAFKSSAGTPLSYIVVLYVTINTPTPLLVSPGPYISAHLPNSQIITFSTETLVIVC